MYSRHNSDSSEFCVAFAHSLDNGRSLCTQTQVVHCILHVTACNRRTIVVSQSPKTVLFTGDNGTVPTEKSGANGEIAVLCVSFFSCSYGCRHELSLLFHRFLARSIEDIQWGGGGGGAELPLMGVAEP